MDVPIVQDTLPEQDAHDPPCRGVLDPTVCTVEGKHKDDGVEQEREPGGRRCDSALPAVTRNYGIRGYWLWRNVHFFRVEDHSAGCRRRSP